MTTAASVELRHVTDAQPVWQTLLDVYADVRAPLLHLPHYAVDSFGERLARHAKEPGFEAVIGYDGDEPVGYAYVNTLQGPEDRWWGRTTGALPAGCTAIPTLALKEIMVRTPWRGSGTARRIHDDLLTGRPEEQVTLMVNPAAGDGKVEALYVAWGYEHVGQAQPSPGSPPLHVMIRAVQTP
jgi:hypothetical protein